MDPKLRGMSRWRWTAAISAACLLTFGMLVSHMQQQAEPGALTTQPHYVTAPPPAAYVPPSASPETSVLGTNASVSTEVVRLQLFKTFPGRTVREGTAVLGTAPENPQTYSTGAVLASGARLEEIHRDHVLLMRGDRFSKLYLVGLAANSDDALLAATTVGGPEFAARPVETRPSSREDYAEFIRPKLVFDDNGEKIAGFEIVAGKNGAQLTRLGLAAGDVIRSIDGRPVHADADWHRISDALSSASTLVLGVERNGNLISVLMDAKHLNSESSGIAGLNPPMPPAS